VESIVIKILVVDDSPMDRALASGLISKRMETEILEACNGREGLSQIELHQPKLVLTDLQMPEMNGLELVAAVKERFPNIPIILMTAQGSEEIAAQALERGAASYVPKRRLADDLVRTMERILTTSRYEKRRSILMYHLTETNTRFTLPNEPEVLQLLVSHVLDLLCCLPLGDETERLRVGVALEEALNNAYYHGNLEIFSNGGVRDRKRYEELARVRSSESPYCDRMIHVQVRVSPSEATFTVRDEGHGFDVSQWLNGHQDTSDPSFGRGIVLMRSIMDEVTYNDVGNEVTLVKRSIEMEDEDIALS
jgi:CheY-like chemotaxis protein/anti-sigma regulatory factor (Ser/Thr protein kinase)